MSRKFNLEQMTWVEAEEAFKKNPVAILPIGTTEENGPACALGIDTIIARYFAEEVGRRTDSIVLPALPYGCSLAFKGFPGTIWLSPETLKMVVSDICASLVHHGVKKLIIANNHMPNQRPAEDAVHELVQQKKIEVIDFWPAMVATDAAVSVFGHDRKVQGHGGEAVTSILMAIDEVCVRKDLLIASTEVKGEVNGFADLKITGPWNALYKSQAIHTFRDMHIITENGQIGDNTNASIEQGKKLLDWLISWGVDLVNDFKKMS